MKVNFIGNYQKGYVGEDADEIHLARELERLGNTVNKIPRDIWKAHCDGEFEVRWGEYLSDIEADINVICKWPHFNNEKYINRLREESGGPVFYFVWDYMWDQGFPDWHLKMAQAADLYLSNEGGLFDRYRAHQVKPYYFPMDVCDGDLPVFEKEKKIYDVVFPGSYLGQGDRIAFLKEINKEIPVKIFAWNYQEWVKEGFDAEPAVYGADFNKMVAQSRVILGFNVNAHCWGYWSNRVGKVIRAGGFLLQQYAPGMENHMPCAFFSSPKEAIIKIKTFPESEFEETTQKAWLWGDMWTSAYRMKQLDIMARRFIEEGTLWNNLLLYS